MSERTTYALFDVAPSPHCVEQHYSATSTVFATTAWMYVITNPNRYLGYGCAPDAIPGRAWRISFDNNVCVNCRDGTRQMRDSVIPENSWYGKGCNGAGLQWRWVTCTFGDHAVSHVQYSTPVYLCRLKATSSFIAATDQPVGWRHSDSAPDGIFVEITASRCRPPNNCCRAVQRRLWLLTAILDHLRLEVMLDVVLHELGVVSVARSHLECPRVLHLLAQVQVRLRNGNAVADTR